MKSSVKPRSKFPMMKEPGNIGIKHMRNIMKLLMMSMMVMVMMTMVVIMVMVIMVMVTIPRQ